MTSSNPALALRQALVDELKKKGDLIDPALEAAFLAVPRHVFLPDVPLDRVYSDEAIPIKRDSDGTILSSSSQPSMMAIMLRQLRLRPGDNVLEIGAGTGYNAAIMQHIVGETGSVTTVELDKNLAYQARVHLQHVALGNIVTVVDADGALGYAPRASYDRIIATAATWDVPQAWVRQLKPDGILVAPMWIEGMQVSAAFTLQPDGTLYSSRNIPCGFISLRGIAAGPNVHQRIRGSALSLSANDADKIDPAAVHSLLSYDAETAHLGIPMSAAEYWSGFLPYVALNTPDGYLFALYSVGENQQAYGLEGYGFALISSGSACFAPYQESGVVQCFGGADAFMALQGALNDWEQAGRPGSATLRLQLLPKGDPRHVDTRPMSRLYPRQYHDLLVWMEVQGHSL